MSNSIGKKMWAGTAIIILLLIGVWDVGCVWAFIGAITSTPPNVVNAFIYMIFIVAATFALGWYVTSHWYKTKYPR